MQKTPKILWYLLFSQIIIFIVFSFVFIYGDTSRDIRSILGNISVVVLGGLLGFVSLISIFLSIKYLRKSEHIILPIILLFISILTIFSPAILFPIKTSLIPLWQAQVQQKAFYNQMTQSQNVSQKMNNLRDVRSLALINNFKNPHKIINFIHIGETNFSGPYYKEQIGVLLDNDVEITVMVAKNKEEENGILERLNNLNLKGVSVIVPNFEFNTNYYMCENPNFSNNTCGKEQIIYGADLKFVSDNKPLDQYLYCHLNYFPFEVGSGGFDSQKYCSN